MTRSRMRRLLIPPVLFLTTAALMWGLDRWLPAPRWWPADYRWVGLLPVGAAIALAVAAFHTFARAGTSPHPWAEPTALVTTGPYRLSRNPMYLGLLLMLCGWWTVLGTAAALVGPPLFVVAVSGLFIRREERLLDARFGDMYLDYRRRVRRWI